MPRDLFGEVDRPSTRVGTRSRYTVPLSLAAHALVVVGILAATILGPAVLPSPASGELILLADMRIPEPPPPRIVAARVTAVAPVNPSAAPTVVPDHIAPEVPAARRPPRQRCHRDRHHPGHDGLQHRRRRGARRLRRRRRSCRCAWAAR